MGKLVREIKNLSHTMDFHPHSCHREWAGELFQYGDNICVVKPTVTHAQLGNMVVECQLL